MKPLPHSLRSKPADAVFWRELESDHLPEYGYEMHSVVMTQQTLGIHVCTKQTVLGYNLKGLISYISLFGKYMLVIHRGYINVDINIITNWVRYSNVIHLLCTEVLPEKEYMLVN